LVVIVDAPGLTAEDMNKLVSLAEANIFNCPVQQVVVDHLNIMKSSGRDPYSKVSNAIKDFRDMIKARGSAAGIILIQTSREGGTGGEPLKLTDARGSGEIEEVVDLLFGIWRPELKARHDVELLKSPGSEGEIVPRAKRDEEGKLIKNESGQNEKETYEEARDRVLKEKEKIIRAKYKQIEELAGHTYLKILKSRREGRDTVFMFILTGLNFILQKNRTESIEGKIEEANEGEDAAFDNPIPEVSEDVLDQYEDIMG
jgi:hypothetical protein